MDTLTFLNAVLPEGGFKFVARIAPRKTPSKSGKMTTTIHYPVRELEEVVETSKELEARYPDNNIYFALASFKDVKYKSVEVKRGDETRTFEYVTGRTQDNVQALKCLWMDLDVGKYDADGALKPDCYATREDALQSLKDYLQATGLPQPIIVSSGYGLHVYWPFTEAINTNEWLTIAKYQRAIMRHLGVKFDPSRDMDSASVLRLPGCYNRKNGAHKLVKIVGAKSQPMPAQEYKRILLGCVEREHLSVQNAAGMDVPEWAMTATGNLTGDVESFPDSFAEIAVNHCQQMQQFRETGGANEPIWYANIGLLKHFKDGEALAHEWGAKYEGYSEEETASKLDQWKYGPTTCQKFKEINAAGCEGCKMTCTSPISLGLPEQPETPNVDEAISSRVAEPSSIPDEPAEAPAYWPNGFGYRAGGEGASDMVTKRVMKADGVLHDVDVVSPLYRPIGQVRQEDGTYAMVVETVIRKERREILIPTKLCADARALSTALYAHQIMVYDQKANLEYMQRMASHTRDTRNETSTFSQMGWQRDYKAFLVGNQLITKDTIVTVPLSESFPRNRINIDHVKGDKQKWIDAVEELYNRPNGEPYQFAICAAFSSPLNPLLGFGEWSGIPYAMTTDRSGYGKTTVNNIALSIWARQDRKMVVANSTPRAILGIASAMNNVPFLLDEITAYLNNPADQSDVFYALSNGGSREGLEKDGTVRNNRPSWNGNFAITSNRNLMQSVTENKTNPEAVQMRLFEIGMDNYPRLAPMQVGTDEYRELNASHAHLTRTIVEECYGQIGVEYVRWLMRNLDEAKAMLDAMSEKLIKYADGDQTKERYYYHLVTTVLVGGKIAKRLGFINFDIDHLMDWCIQHIRLLREQVASSQLSSEDYFSMVLSQYASQFLVTKNFQTLDGRSRRAEPHAGLPIRGPIVGRYVIGADGERPQLYLKVDAVRQWCAEHQIQFNVVRQEWITRGLIRMGSPECNKKTGAQHVNLSRGVVGAPYLGAPWCFELDVERAATGMLQKGAAPDNVLPMASNA